MDKFNVSWVWFALAIAALVTAVVAKGMAALFFVLAIVCLVAGIFFVIRR
jgi:hypothetical protein